jgi:hypothetical protein
MGEKEKAGQELLFLREKLNLINERKLRVESNFQGKTLNDYLQLR